MQVRGIFETMEWGPAPESAAEALDWIARHGGRFGHFIGGRFTEPGETFATKSPATGDVLAEVTQASVAEVDAAVAAARAAQPGWAALSGHERARHLYALARGVQRQARLFAVLETLDTGKPIRESRDIDVPLVARHFSYHAGMAQLMASGMPGRVALGVCGQIVPWNFPLLMLAWKIAPALAAGNTVVLKPAEWTPLTALRFAELCRQVGLPEGVVNIVTGDGAVGEAIVAHAGVDKIAFTGSTEVGRRIRRATAGTGKALTLELGGKSPYIVFDDADLDSAVEGLVDAIWFNAGQVCCAGSRLLVQEGVAELFHAKLRARMDRLRVGDPLDKAVDVGAVVDPAHRARVARMVAQESEGEVWHAACPIPETGAYYPPTLITGLSPASPLMQEEIFGPVLVSGTFRTPDEAVHLANDTRYGLAASVWSETLNLALGVAPRLEAGVIWVNGTNMFDAAAGFGGLRESGFDREGGWEGMLAYTKDGGETKPLVPVAPMTGEAGQQGLDRTAKLYIGGRQVRPDGGYARDVFGAGGRLLAQVPAAGRKDVRNAVEAARKANGWAQATAYNRAQVIYYMAENLSARAAEIADRLDAMTGTGEGAAELEASVGRLFHWAAWADKWEGRTKPVPLRGTALAMRAPVGVIGVFCPDESPLLGFVTCLGAAMAMGNRVVAIASEPFPLAATDFCQVLETSDVPAGVANVLTGTHADLAPVLAAHMDVEAVWSFSSSDVSGAIERESAGNLKRTWVNHGRARDWAGAAGESVAFLEAATEVKTVWVPWGE